VSVRRHPITGEPILHAPMRAARPGAFADEKLATTCAFCPGHEDETPPELARVGDPWRVRVFPNKYPSIAGAEVIVESPGHDDRIEDLTGIDEVLSVYRDRVAAHAEAAHVALFRNDGARAGSSMAHLHSQLVPLPFVPPRVQREIEALRAGCALCSGCGVTLGETGSFVWLAVEPAWMPYQQWLVPRRHVASLRDLDRVEMHDLGVLLQRAARATRRIGDANTIFMNFPVGSAAHFYVEILPRVATIAGLELGTGTFVEIVDAAAAAERVRD
jgi:UDPglucose--hexose-1-phosphate uridylyltransferase